eukprot:UN14340
MRTTNHDKEQKEKEEALLAENYHHSIADIKTKHLPEENYADGTSPRLEDGKSEKEESYPLIDLKMKDGDSKDTVQSYTSVDSHDNSEVEPIKMSRMSVMSVGNAGHKVSDGVLVRPKLKLQISTSADETKVRRDSSERKKRPP